MVKAAARRTEPRKPALKVRQLDKSFGDVKVLNAIDLDMQPGEFLVLVGPSGCGKSTLLNCIAGLEEVSGGEIFIGGRNVTEIPPRDRDIAMVFQSYALYPSMTVAENIGFGMKVRKVPREELAKKILEVARILQIEHLMERKPAHLSGGQRQRVAMGRALVRDPELFLFDEPLSNLDAKLRVEMRGEIKALHERLGASIVYVTHDQVEAMTLGSRIVVLRDGNVLQIGTPDEIYNRPANLFVADFMGSPPMNLVPGVLRIADNISRIHIGDQSAPLVWTIEAPSTDLRAFDGKKIILGIRPEAFTKRSGKAADFTLKTVKTENAGSDIYATLDFAGTLVAARFAAHSSLRAGEAINVGVDNRNICYFDPESERRIG